MTQLRPADLPGPGPSRAPTDATPALEGLRAGISHLLREADRLGLLADDLRGAGAEQPGGDPATDALSRLLQGTGDDEDLHLLPAALAGARVLVVRHADASRAAAWCSGLRAQAHAPVTVVRGELTASLLINNPRASDADRARAVAERLAASARRADGAARCGLSRPLAERPDLAAAYRDACDASCVPPSGDGPLTDAQDDWAALLQVRLRPRLRAAAQSVPALQALAAYDEKHQMGLLPTLGAWLRANRDIQACARALHVHVNTARYRLQRARQVGALDLDDPVQLALLTLITHDLDGT